MKATTVSLPPLSSGEQESTPPTTLLFILKLKNDAEGWASQCNGWGSKGWFFRVMSSSGESFQRSTCSSHCPRKALDLHILGQICWTWIFSIFPQWGRGDSGGMIIAYRGPPSSRADGRGKSTIDLNCVSRMSAATRLTQPLFVTYLFNFCKIPVIFSSSSRLQLLAKSLPWTGIATNR